MIDKELPWRERNRTWDPETQTATEAVDALRDQFAPYLSPAESVTPDPITAPGSPFDHLVQLFKKLDTHDHGCRSSGEDPCTATT